MTSTFDDLLARVDAGSRLGESELEDLARGADILPLSGLTKGQGKQLLRHLDAPARLYEKIPTADLLDDKPGQSDEAELGLTYADIDAYLEGREIDPEVAEKLEQRYRITEHKRRVPVTPFDDWWRRA